MKYLVIVFVFLLGEFSVQAAKGMVKVESKFSVSETADRLEAVLKNKGMTVFNRIQHSESAEKVGIELRETELIIFGNPKAGSPLMKCQQSLAIDLPQKALIWKDENNKVWLSYNDLTYLAERHSIVGCDKALLKVNLALDNLSKAATSK